MPTDSPLPAACPVALAKAYRLINHGPTLLVTSRHGPHRNVMAAAWNMPLNINPPRVAVVIDQATWTRELVERSQRFVLNVPSASLATTVLAVGQSSGRTTDAISTTDKISQHGLKTFTGAHPENVLLQGCLGWLECVVRPELQEGQVQHDLFLADVSAAWADPRIFRDGHWHYSPDTPPHLRTLHYVAGGHFLTIGEPCMAAVSTASPTP